MSEFVYPQFGQPAIYVDPLIVSFAATPAVAELGSTVDSVVLNWTLSKTPKTVKLNNVAQPLFQNQATVTGPFTTDQAWTLAMTDEIGSGSKKATLSFQNKLYWMNVSTAPTNSAGILALSNSFFVTKYARTLEVGTPNGKFPCFAWPKSLAAVRRVVIGIPNPAWAGDSLVSEEFTDFTLTTVAFTNASGYTEDYYVLCFNSSPDVTSLKVQLA